MHTPRTLWRAAAAFIAATILATLTVTAPAGAQSDYGCRPEGGYTVSYLNGISNTWTQAFSSRAELQAAYGDTHNGEPITYNNLYNDTHGVAQDVAEVFEQKVREAVERGVLTEERISRLISNVVGTSISVVTAPQRLAAWLMAQVPIGVIQDAGRAWGDFLAELPGWYESAHNKVNSWMTDQIRKFADETLLDPETRAIIDNHVSTVRSQIASGRKPLIVSHSQGNLFATPIATKARAATASNAVRVAHVATPAKLLAGGYVTIDTDMIIAPFFGTGQAPDPNVSMQPLLAGTNHGFGNAYLRHGEQARTSVLNLVRDELNGIQLPVGTGSDGLFTVTLTWPTTGDVDLHTFEPNGRHVYYGAKQGNFGFLDVDNTSGYGPEHYYADCTPAAIGTFTIGVTNYSRVNAGTPVTVQLSSATFIGEPVVLNVGGSVGSSSMQHQVFQVQVTQDPDGQLRVTQL